MNSSIRRVVCILGFLTMCAVVSGIFSLACAADQSVSPKMWLDPITRYIHISYPVPSDAPDEVQVICTWSPRGKDSWSPARVTPFISETGNALATNADRAEWQSGRVTERRAAGLRRTVIFDPYPEALIAGLVDIDFRISIQRPSGTTLSLQSIRLKADNTDVVYLTDWSNVFQKDLISTTSTDGKWLLSKDASGGNRLSCKETIPVAALSYPLDLKGQYSVFVSTDPNVGPAMLRFSGDERTERVSSSSTEKEVLWRRARMDRQHLVIKQRHYFTGYTASSLNYVKFVPLSKKDENGIRAIFAGKHDKFVGAYFEPYSWAFYAPVTENYQHREPISAYAEAGVDLIAIPGGRFGMKSVYESRTVEQLLYSTEGDPIDGKVPVTDNVGRMQQYTNMFESEIKYAREMGLNVSGQFGATACYVDSPLESDFSKQHPKWRRNDSLLLSVPEVRDYMLKSFREILEIGVPGISIDFCRYPDGVDSAKDCNELMRGMRKLADEFGKVRGKHVPILVRFPSTGTRRWQNFDYNTWAKEGLVDYLCPSNIQGVYQYFDVKPYLDAVKGNKCKVTPEIDALEWGPVMPGQFLRRLKQVYDAGAYGVYVYQADGVLNSRSERECLSIAGNTAAVDRWLKNEEYIRPHCSKGIYITRPANSSAYGFYDRMQIWVEGVKTGEVETYIDGKLIGKMNAFPYLLGTDGYESDKVVSIGEHKLLVRVKDGNGWLEQTFTIKGQ